MVALRIVSLDHRRQALLDSVERRGLSFHERRARVAGESGRPCQQYTAARDQKRSAVDLVAQTLASAVAARTDRQCAFPEIRASALVLR
jgi:hypothetical protein